MAGTRRAAWAMVALFALVQPIAPHRTQAQSDHRLVWRTIRTEHFRIHYHEPLGLLARHFAAQAEAVNTRVSRALGLSLRQPVELVISDDDDAANGSATPLPYNVIRLRAVAPEDMSPLVDYDDWPTLLLTHEHTHILHLEEASGLPRALQAIFGRVYTPQQFLPGWFVEGLAVVEETAQTSRGRGRGSQFDMYMRMDALEDRVLGLDWIGFDGEPWPHGNTRYVYGQAFLQYIADRYGERSLGAFAREYGRRLVPYGLNRAAKRATGKTFVALYGEFVAATKARAEAVRARVEREGRVEGTRITFHGETTRSPRFLSDRELAYMVSDERHVPELRRVSMDGSGAKRLTRVPGNAAVSRVPGAPDALLYSAGEYHRGAYFYQELHRLQLDGNGRERLTAATRAREPDVSPDGKRVAFVTHSAGTSHLEVGELDDVEHTRKVLVRSRRFEQVFTPRWSPDGTQIAYGAFSEGGYRDIWLVNVRTGARTRLTYDPALDRGPVFSPDGRTLYFSSDRSGIANLYAYQLGSGEISQVTNVVGGAYMPDVSPDGRHIVYVGYTSKGFDLYTLELEGVTPRPALPSYERPPMHALAPPLAAQSAPYQPFSTLAPRTWSIATDDPGDGQRVTIETSGKDAVGFHAWSLSVSQNLEIDERSADIGYSYRRPRFPLHVRFTVGDHVRANDLVFRYSGNEWDARLWQFMAGSAFSFPAPLRTFTLRPDYALSYLEKRAGYGLRLDPNYPPPEYPDLGFDARLSVTATLATAQRQAYDISQSWGYVLTVSPSIRDPLLGSQVRDKGIAFRLEEFVRFDFRESVLAFAYTGAFDVLSSVGGLPATVGPIFDYITGSRGSPVSYTRLRGYPVRYGDKLASLQLEYRALVMRVNRGLDTLPWFARRVHAALFTDVGDAWTGSFAWSRVGVGVGGELRFDFGVDYGGQELTLRLGIARGLTEDGELQWYASMTKAF